MQNYESSFCNKKTIFAISKFGGLAQLVEHLYGIQGVIGSSPLSSTKFLNGIVLFLFAFLVAILVRVDFCANLKIYIKVVLVFVSTLKMLRTSHISVLAIVS